MRRYAGAALWLGPAEMKRRLTQLSEALDSVDSPLIVRVAYADLTKHATVRACLKHLGVPEPRFLDQFMHFNVQSDLGWNVRWLSERAAS